MPRASSNSRAALLRDLSERIVGQPDALEAIVPRIQLYQAGLNPEGRPAGVFMLLGPTGVGKTRTAEAVAEIIHGSSKHLLRIDCGEFQMEHEVAKLIGAPPGYLGHRETQPALTQMKLNQVMSERANLAIVLFDEIEKAAPSMLRLLLGILDRGVLKLGDNTTVQFERTLIFFTSNLGASEIARETGRGFGLRGAAPSDNAPKDLSRITRAAIERKLSPEFINRVDAFLTYHPLTPDNIRSILDLQIRTIYAHLVRRLGDAAPELTVTPAARDFLIARGYSPTYGARELNRTIEKHLVEPLAGHILDNGKFATGDRVTASFKRGSSTLTLTVENPATTSPTALETRPRKIQRGARTVELLFTTAAHPTE